MEEIKLNWSLPEYKHQEKTQDWFVALAIIIICSAIISLISGNFFFAILLVLSGIMIAYFAKKKPELVDYELNDEGLMIKNRLFSYESLSAFYVSREDPPHLFVRSSRIFMPIISLPVSGELAEQIEEIFLSKEIPEQEMKEHASHHVMDALGF